MKKTHPLAEALGKFLARFIPTHSRPRVSERHAPPGTLAWLDADTMAAILQEAEDGYLERLMALYRDIMVDSHLQGEFNKRKLAVLKELPSISPADRDDPEALRAAAAVRAMWDGLKGKREALTHLLDSALYPVSLVRKQFRAVSGAGGLRYRLEKLEPVPHHLLDCRDGCLKVRDVSADGRPLDTYHAPSAAEYIIHRGHLLTNFPDKWGGPMRAVVFWFLFKTMNREWWARFLDRFGSPFLVGKYDDGDDRSRSELATAFSQATRIFGLTIPAGSSVEMMQSASATAGDAFLAFAEHANAELSKLIVGQTMTTTASSNGMSGAQAEVHAAVRDDIAAFDAMALAETLRDDLFDQYLTINGNFAARPAVTFGGQAVADATATSALLTSLAGAGWEPGEEAREHLSRTAGFPVVKRAAAGGATLPLDAASANFALAENGAAVLARAYRRRFAGLPRLVGESASPADLDRRLLAALGSSDGPAANVLADVLASYAVNAGPPA
jgi:phage gp29-like protein